MANAGYSQTPLQKKLGLKEELKIWLIHPPENYFQLLDANITTQICLKNELPDFIHLFASSQKVLEKEMPGIIAACLRNPKMIVWISWYKKSSGMATDLTDNEVRACALANGLVDIKVCAVSELWSGLKFVVPLSKRKSASE
jgi:hypothetical protein